MAGKRMNQSDVVGAGLPILRVLRNLTKEYENGEAGLKFMLLELNTSSPFPETLVRTPIRPNFESWVRMRMRMLNLRLLEVISDLS